MFSFQPQVPKLTPEELAMLRQKTKNSLASFFLLSVTLQLAPYAVDAISKLL
ncbi:hypothetical protein DSO57_1008280 [Entomophthora muscae]|uniref:Uncharacterized protein n=1 Tax=Entomophthora muscae TaxID=34485 RepID=A0ACC2UGV2_9FUNG|nr:hypothetical protein DSO57_1008280 [Entomophthora muscae]